jgi:formate transporter
MSYYTPNEMANIAVKTGVKKATTPLLNVLFLGFLGGAFISLGYLFYIRVVAGLPHEWGTLSSLIGAAVFPLGLILVVVAGGELLTSTMMATSIAAFAKKITFKQLAVNWILVTISNFIGALFVAYFFGHLLGFTETDIFLEKTIAIATAKLNDPFWMAFISGIGCNWLVSLGVWISYSAEDTAGKIIGLLFPITAFVAIGFQHVVANMFVIPAAIFAGAFTWGDYFANFVPVFLGNGFGGVVLVAGMYYAAYLRTNTNKSKVTYLHTSSKKAK